MTELTLIADYLRLALALIGRHRGRVTQPALPLVVIRTANLEAVPFHSYESLGLSFAQPATGRALSLPLP